MLVLYYGKGATHDGGAIVFSTTDHISEYKDGLISLLTVRKEQLALELFNRFEWGLRPSEIWVDDHYYVLFAGAYLEDYEYARSIAVSAEHMRAIQKIAEVLHELGVSRLRYIGVSLDSSPRPQERQPNALTSGEVRHLVNDYIGVNGGYLGDFSYRSHKEFYEDLNLPYKPDTLPGTTRQRFINILSEASPLEQAKILRGIIDRYPVGSSTNRTEKILAEVLSWVGRLEGGAAVSILHIKVTNGVVRRALADAERLLTSSGATSAVDRVHTALHGYMKGIAADEGLALDEDASLTQAFKLLRTKHPKLQLLGPRSDDVAKALFGLASVVDALNPLRNKASIAHANRELLDEPEALLVVNSTRTILDYLDRKLSAKE